MFILCQFSARRNTPPHPVIFVLQGEEMNKN
ncbi:unnamed protein product, partial [Rotaria sp. Silwood1]